MSQENRSLKDSLIKWQQCEQASREKEERARAEKAEESQAAHTKAYKNGGRRTVTRNGRNEDDYEVGRDHP